MSLRSSFLCSVLCLCAAQASAAELAVGVPAGGFGFALHLARDRSDLSDDVDDTGTRLSRAGVTLSETVGDGMTLGLLLGYASASQTGQALTAGMRFTGNYLGVNIHGTIPAGQRLRIGLTGRFLYHWLRDEVEDQKVDLDWAQADAAMTLQADLAGSLTTYAGLLWSTIEVDQRARGLVDATSTFENPRTSGAVYGLRLEVDYRGWVGLEARRGPFDGVALSFQRSF